MALVFLVGDEGQIEKLEMSKDPLDEDQFLRMCLDVSYDQDIRVYRMPHLIIAGIDNAASEGCEVNELATFVHQLACKSEGLFFGPAVFYCTSKNDKDETVVTAIPKPVQKILESGVAEISILR